MGWTTYARSKMPLKLVFIIAVAFVLNGALALGVQLLTSYRFSGPIEAEMFGRMDESYENCEILDLTYLYQDSNNDLFVYLVQVPDGQQHLVTVRKHYLFDRYKLERNASMELDPKLSEIKLRAGTSMLTLSVSESTVLGHTDIQMISWSGIQSRHRFSSAMFLTIVALCVVEYIAYIWLFKRDEIT